MRFALLAAHLRDRCRLSSLFFASRLRDHPCIPTGARGDVDVHDAEERTVVGRQASRSSLAFGHRARCALAAPQGFFYSHLGWIFTRAHDTADLNRIADFARYP